MSDGANASGAEEAAAHAEMRVIEALRQGDEAVFARLVDQHHAGLRRVARLYVSNRAVADEVVQDAWLGVIQGIWDDPVNCSDSSLANRIGKDGDQSANSPEGPVPVLAGTHTRWTVGASGRRRGQLKERSNMAKAMLTLVLLCMMTDPLMAQEPTVTSLMAKELTDIPGKEVLMITVLYPPGGSDPVHRHNAHGFIYVLEGSVCDAGEGRQTSNTDAGTGLL
jgi:hypothetical protein